MMEALDIPLIGSTAECAYVAQNKATARALYQLNGVAIPEGFVVKKDDDMLHHLENLGYPCIVKPARAEDSQGVSLVKTKSELDEAFRKAYEVDDLGIAIVER